MKKKIEHEEHSDHASGNRTEHSDTKYRIRRKNDLQCNNPQNRHEDTKLDTVYVPKHELITINRWWYRERVSILKGDGCNTGIVSKEFVRWNEHICEMKNKKMTIKHSEKQRDEHSNELFTNGTLELESHRYICNWITANSRYDVIIGMPGHVGNNDKIDSQNSIIQVYYNKVKISTIEEQKET